MAAATATAGNAVNDCFSIGSTVMCTTCFNEEVEGEVLAFDHNTKMLILIFPRFPLSHLFPLLPFCPKTECRSKTTEELSDIYALNLSLCSNVQVIKECNGNFVDDPQKLNLEQVKMRLRKTVERRQDYLKSQNADVSSEAQELYRAIAKQYGYNEVSWQGLNIQILNEVTISPPYRVDNVVSSSNNETSCNYIKRIIKQFFNSRISGAQDSTSNAAASTSSASVSPTSSSLSSSNAASGSPVPAN
ncbi:protein LSM12 homolog A isoform X1 [Drosophila persimilis]|uniref:protein LSM12 homolog A isoform X1 n=1 Tax=Drosophila persimilis TaxID=7234 RepID=UPI000F093475|nr:protein LSM12 homolog A isoform X1 [Drosophila persimilis]